MASTTSIPAIETTNLEWDYGGGAKVLSGVNMKVEGGSRVLLIGANGTGKTTLLRLLAGKHFHEPDAIRVNGHSAFHSLPQGVTLLGGDWAHNPSVRKDVSVTQLVKSMGGDENIERRDHLIELLEIDLKWRMHQVSDGERRRVQIMLGLLQPFSVLLLDEVTVDLDLVVRQDFLAYLKEETEKTGATIVYATHIFDGLGSWYTHLAHLSNGSIARYLKQEEVEQKFVQDISPTMQKFGNSWLMSLVELWLRTELKERRERRKKELEAGQEQRKPKSLLEQLSQSTTTDKYYNYWNH